MHRRGGHTHLKTATAKVDETFYFRDSLLIVKYEKQWVFFPGLIQDRRFPGLKTKEIINKFGFLFTFWLLKFDKKILKVIFTNIQCFMLNYDQSKLKIYNHESGFIDL